jgi:hypothetical protein
MVKWLKSPAVLNLYVRTTRRKGTGFTITTRDDDTFSFIGELRLPDELDDQSESDVD